MSIKSKNWKELVIKSDKFLFKIIGINPDTDEPAWWIIRVFPEKLSIFESIIDKGNLDFTQYGIVLDSGFGNKIPHKILKKYEC